MQRLHILQQLTGRPTSARSYLLSIRLTEISSIIVSKVHNINPTDILDRNVLYSFQVTPRGHLYMVMKVLLPNRIRILDFVQATIWPKLIDNKLAVDTTVPYDSFLSLSEEHFVEVSSAWINECLEDPDRCYTDVVPRRIMSEGIPPLVEQFLVWETEMQGIPSLRQRYF